MIEAQKIDITELRRRGVNQASAIAAAVAEAEGRSPREQLVAARQAQAPMPRRARQNLGYTPHQGAKEIARRARKLAHA